MYKDVERESKLLGSCLHFPLCSCFFKRLFSLYFKVFIEFVTTLLLFYGLVFGCETCEI